MSCMSWVVNSTVTPRSRLISRMKSRTASLLTASRPMVGSSRKRMSGSCSRAAATSQRILWPRLNCLAGVRSSGPRSSISLRRRNVRP